LNEACKLAGLHHPNVVAFYGVVLDGPGDSVATVTEYMVNDSLLSALERNDKYENFHPCIINYLQNESNWTMLVIYLLNFRFAK